MIWGYILMAYFSLFALGLSDNIRGPLYPDILKTFDVSDTRGAMFFWMASLLGFCGSFLVRFLLRRLSRVQTLRLAMALMTLSLWGMGWSPDFSWLLFFASSFGLSLGLVGVVQNVLVTLGSLPERRQQMMSGLHATYGMASLLAPLTVAGVNYLTQSWRWSLYAAALVAGLVFITSLFTKEVAVGSTESLTLPKKNQHWRAHVGQFYIALAMSCYVAIEILVESRLALYLRRDFAFDLTQSTYYVTAFFVLLLSGRLLFTFYNIRIPLRRVLSFSLVGACLLMVLGLTYSPLFLVFSGIAMAPFYPLAMAYISEKFHHSLDSAISTTLAMTYLITVVMHSLVGYLTDVYGISKALWVGPVCLTLAFILLNTFEMLFKKEI